MILIYQPELFKKKKISDKDFPYRVTIQFPNYFPSSFFVFDKKILTYLNTNVGVVVNLPNQYKFFDISDECVNLLKLSKANGFWMVKCPSKVSVKYYFQTVTDAISFKLIYKELYNIQNGLNNSS